MKKSNITPVFASLAGALLAGCVSNSASSAAPAKAASVDANPRPLEYLAPAESSKLNDIRIGMTKDEVRSVLGTPDSTSAQANTEYMGYYLGSPDGLDHQYVVRVVDGRVESFGRFAELLDLYNRPVGGPSAVAGADLATKLEVLGELKQQGLLTDAEFQRIKARLLSKT